MPKREEAKKMATRSGEREEKKTIPVSPPTTSPSEETKLFEDELRRAMDLSEKEVKKGDEEELQLLKKVLKESLHDEIKRSLEKTSTSSQPPEMDAIKSLLSDLNQDREAVQRIVEVVNVHNERLRQQEEDKARREEEELAALRKKRQEEEEEAAKKDKGKGKLEESPIPSPKPMEIPELPYDSRDYEEEFWMKLQHEEESRQEGLDTLNALLEHYKKEAAEAKANRKDYEAKWLEASKKLAQ